MSDEMKVMSLDQIESALRYTGKKADLDAVKAEVEGIRVGADGTFYDSAGEAVRAVGSAVEDFKDEINTTVSELSASVPDGLLYEGTNLYLMHGDEIVSEPVTIEGGSGGGVTSYQYTVTFTNKLESRIITATENASVQLAFEYTSVDASGADDGAGNGVLTVNGVKVLTFSIAQGDNTLEVGSYLSVDTNTVKVTVTNSEGTVRNLSYTINVAAFSIKTSFSEFTECSGDVVFYYTPVGTGTKTVYFIMDGVQIGTATVETSGRSQSYTIPAQADGGHVFDVYATMVAVDGVTVLTSNKLRLGLLYTSPTMVTQAIICTSTQTTAVQGETVSLNYMAYDPNNQQATVTLSILAGGVTTSTQTLTVDRTAQTWTIQELPTGTVTFRLVCGSASAEVVMVISEYDLGVEAVTDALSLYFNPSGRSNNEQNPGTWTDDTGEISATFSGIAFSNADGWLTDAEGAPLLRVLPGGTVTIPYQTFASDFRATGETIEVEMATHNVQDYDTVVASCLSGTNGDRGLMIASQYASLKSEQSSISMQFKEDEKVRLSFVVGTRTGTRLISVYVDGVMCGVVQYPDDDDFTQTPPVGLTIGANASGIDIYRIRIYGKELTRYEILDNYIVDRPLLTERIALADENDLFNTAFEIQIEQLPTDLPYMIIACAELPQSKGDKKTCSIQYVNKKESARSFTADGATIDVQGTSSAGYKKKNFKIKFANGITYTESGTQSSSYALREDSIPVKTFCMKADVASSESANNVELVRLYEDTIPYKTPPQQTDERVRQGIDGLPCVIFWRNTTDNTVTFWGKYNFNNDKGTEDTFGFTSGCESWEFSNNTSERVIFKSADFTSAAEGADDHWSNDFEARYPEDNTDISNFAAVCAWVCGTDRDVDGLSDSEKETRLATFKNEFEDHFVKDATLYYYIFTEVFLMVDSRAKNMFLTTYDGTHWMPIPYDFDTAIGINNEGQLTFDYDLEDTDTVSGANVFNGQDSVLWKNVRDAFPDDIKSMYQSLRSGGVFSFDEVISRFDVHQSAWPEGIWNEDAWSKYLEPLENDGDATYLKMLQGDKASQRKWWLFNAFRYRDSKYQCGDATNQYIMLRCYTAGDITVTPYSHIWPCVKYGSYTVTERGKRNETYTLKCPLTTMNDTEVFIYSADRLASIGDLSQLQVGYADFSRATKLQTLKLGDSASSYQNTHLNELSVGNNELLQSLDIRNCTALTQSINLSGCVGLKTVYAAGSVITGLSLPVGGKVESLELPGTLTNLTLRDLKQLSTLSIAGYSALTTLRLENTPDVAVETIVNNAGSLNRVRILNMTWNATSEDTLKATVEKLKTCKGMDATGTNTDTAVVTGTVYVDSCSDETILLINESFPELTVIVNGAARYVVRYLDWDNTLLYQDIVSAGDNAIDPVAKGLIETPTRLLHRYIGFGTLPTDIQSNTYVYAQYKSATAVTVPTQSGTLTYTGSAQSPTWNNYNTSMMTIDGVQSATDAGTYIVTFTPTFSDDYVWSDGSIGDKEVLWTIQKIESNLSIDKTSISLGLTALTDSISFAFSGGGEATVSSDNTNVAEAEINGSVVTVTARGSGTATITISVAETTNSTASSAVCSVVSSNVPSITLADNDPSIIQEAAAAGVASSLWSVGDKIGIALNGTVGSLALADTYYAFIIGFDHNSGVEGNNTIHFQFGKTVDGIDIAFTDSSYNSTGSSAAFRMNTSNTNSGGWTGSYMYKTIIPAFLAAMPTEWQNVITACTKYSDNTGGGSDTASYVTASSSKVWLLSEFEVQGKRSYANSAEQNYQKQYAYYANGNSKIKYQHSSTGSACLWWLRSVYYYISISFCIVSSSGSAYYASAYCSYGFAPGFSVK